MQNKGFMSRATAEEAPWCDRDHAAMSCKHTRQNKRWGADKEASSTEGLGAQTWRRKASEAGREKTTEMKGVRGRGRARRM